MKKAIDFSLARPTGFFLVAALLWLARVSGWRESPTLAGASLRLVPPIPASPTPIFNQKFQLFTSKPYANVSKI